MAQVREGTYYNIINLNRIFLIAVVLLFISVVWMVWADYARDWKKYQKEFTSLKREKLIEKLEKSNREFKEKSQQEYDVILARITDLEKNIQDASNEPDHKDSMNLKNKLEGMVFSLSQELQFAKSQRDAAKYIYKKNVAEKGEENSEKEKSRLVHWQNEVGKLTGEVKIAKDELQQAQKKTDAFKKEINALQLKISKLTIERDRISNLIENAVPGPVNFFRNAPLLDFVSPSLKIRQVLLDGLKEELNFVRVPRVDRCTTCHMGIADADFKNAPKPFNSHPGLELYAAEKSHHPVEKFGCTICHEGRGRATDFARVAHTPINSNRESEWRHKYRWEKQEHWDFPMLPRGYVQASCQKCHMDTKELSGAEVLSRGWNLIEKRGCLGCHKIEGLENARRIGPDLTGVGDKVSRKWLIKWLKKPKSYLPKTKMPDFILSDKEAMNLSTYVMTFKREEFLQLPDPPDGDEDKGKDIFLKSACVTCHAVNGRGGDIGPDLGRVGNKINKKWLFYWIKNPRHVYTETTRPVMPRYSFTDEQIADISSYIMSEFIDYDMLEKEENESSLPPSTPGEFEAGRKLFKDYGCGGCHPSTESAKEWVRIGPELSSEGRKRPEEFDFGLTKIRHTLRDFIFTKLKDPRIFETPDIKLRMPQLDISDDDAYAITIVVMGLVGERVSTEEYVVPPIPESTYKPEGPFKKIIDRYACFTCHTIHGKGGTLAPDLTFEGSKVQKEWLRDFLMITHSINPLIANAMPIFNFSDEEKDIIVTYMKTVLTNENVPEKLEEKLTPEMAKEGEVIFNRSGCAACHIKGEGGGYVGPSFTTGKYYAGDRLTTGWIYKWLENPRALNPKTIEPRYGFTEMERLALTAYLMSLKNPGDSR